MDGSFQVHEWCLYHSDILLTLHQARKNFEEKNNKTFDLKKFCKAPIRIVFDALHGISTDYVKLPEALEIMAYCLYDGKVDQQSEFETSLYNSLLDQLKEMKDIPGTALALIRMYLQVLGKPGERMFKEQIWCFTRKDFKNAITSLLLNDDDDNNELVLKMVNVVRMHFNDEQQIFEWTKDIFRKHAESFKEALKESSKKPIYISVKTRTGGPKDKLSGKYDYIWTKDNVDMFAKPLADFSSGLYSGSNTYPASKFFLIYRNGFWFITSDEFALYQKKTDQMQGYVRLETKVLDPLALSTQWKELGSIEKSEADRTSNKVATVHAYDKNGRRSSNNQDVVATVKIFSDENEYNKH